MIEVARKYNSHENCVFVLNDSDTLSFLQSNTFDFIYTTLVLQHMLPEFSKGFIKEFLRLLVPGGVLIFQLPAGKDPNYTAQIDQDGMIRKIMDLIKGCIPSFILNMYVKLRYPEGPKWEMHSVDREEITSLVISYGGDIFHIEENKEAGPSWISYRYFVQKAGDASDRS